jgi:hypothetical protein
MAHRHGLPIAPKTVAELGPGDSVGVGLAAVLTGSEQYVALDVVGYANVRRNLEIMDGLVDLIKQRAPIPHDRELVEVQPSLDSYEFPSEILTDQRLESALAPARLEWVRLAALEIESAQLADHPALSYRTSWSEAAQIQAGSIDMIFSQAVLEHVEDLAGTYGAMRAWLRSGGFLSHQIDFRSHGWTKRWNGHWALSDQEWRLTRGKRAYALNGEPCSRHLQLLNELGFSVDCVDRMVDTTGIDRASLAPRYRQVSDEDLRTSGVFVQARKGAA